MNNKAWIFSVATLALASAIGVARGFPGGPSVSTGSNPLRQFLYADKPCTPIVGALPDGPKCSSFSKKKQVFEVPQGQTLVITDFRFRTSWPADGVPDGYAAEVLAGQTFNTGGDYCAACLVVDGTELFCGNQDLWSTGVAIASGAKVELFLSNGMAEMSGSSQTKYADATCVAVATGYLMRN